ncbi:MAG: amidohydrolase [bacterium]
MDLSNIRRYLHKHPEPSMREEKTAQYLHNILKETGPDSIVANAGAYSIMALYRGGDKGDTVMLRCDIDALPIEEENLIDYSSVNEGYSHKCGHDGHMTIMLGLADRLSKRDFNGNVVLLFQSGEETAEGARAVLDSGYYSEFKPDWIFGLHNLPGYEEGSIIVKNDIFASASKGLKIFLRGETSHAGQPEDGNNPSQAMNAIINMLQSAPNMYTGFHDNAVVTVVNAALGEVAFGTSPGAARIFATLRTYNNAQMMLLSDKIIKMTQSIAAAFELDMEYQWVEAFPALVNNNTAAEIVRKAADRAELSIVEADKPFSWSEDFAYYLAQTKGAFFGLGSGFKCRSLHNSDYDFPEDIIGSGIDMFYSIIHQINNGVS